MSDTQWPRFEVFQQEKPGQPHRSIGTVHAPDAEMALQNGRDLFVRRPECHSLWVVPAEAIFTKTAEELQQEPGWYAGKTAEGDRVERYLVFCKQSQRRAMAFVQHVGEVEAASADQAMAVAIAKFDDGRTFVWWVCPDRLVARSEEEDVASWFAPARDKSYRQPNQYRTVSMMQEIMRVDQQSPEEE